MKETMGQIIRKLRKERNLTQEELAEQLGVTFQAVSKWENDTGMPDISQIVPLAYVFDVSTDILFGIQGTEGAEEARKIAENARAKITYPVTKEVLREWYNDLQKGLKKYPNNTLLLSHSLEAGIALAYPENDVYDSENGEAIYKECTRQADIIIKYGKNSTDILRAHMIMVLLHSAYGNFEAANKHSDEFPWRADMTVHEMKAFIAHFKNDLHAENKCWQTDFIYHLEAMLDDMVAIGCSYYQLEKYEKAEYTFKQALEMIALIFKDEAELPRLHKRERGDIYSLLAEIYIKQNKKDDALSALTKMVEFDTRDLPHYLSGKKLKTALLCDVDHNFYWNYANYKEIVLGKLKNPSFDSLKDDPRFLRLIAIAEAL